MIESTADFAATTHILCCSCGMYFSAAASSENDHGSMNLDSKTAPELSTRPSRVAAIHRTAGCRTRRWTSMMTCPELTSYQRRFRSSVTDPPASMIRLSAACSRPQASSSSMPREVDQECGYGCLEAAVRHVHREASATCTEPFWGQFSD